MAQIGDLEAETTRRSIVGGAPRGEETSLTLGSLAKDFGKGMVNTIVTLLGAPVDLANLLAGIIVSPTVAEIEAGAKPRAPFTPLLKRPPFGGESLRGVLAEPKVPIVPGLPFTKPSPVELTPSEELVSPTRRIATRVGEEVGAGVTVLGPFLKLAQRGKGFGLPFIGKGLRFAAEKPGQFAALELGAATTGGAGAALLREAAPPEEPGTRLALDIAGAVTGSFAVAPLMIVTRLTGKGIKTIVPPLTPAARRRRAQEIVQVAAREPAKALDTLEKALEEIAPIEGATLRPAQLANDPGLLDLEASVFAQNANLRGVADSAAEQTAAALRAKQEIILGGRLAKREFLEGKVDHVTELLGRRMNQAARLATEKIDALGPTPSAADKSAVVRNEVEAALTSARLTEDQFYLTVDPTRLVPRGPIERAMASILAAKGKVRDISDILPPEIVERFGRLDPQETLNEVRLFRSLVLQAQRAERAALAPNYTRIKNLGELQESALDAMGLLADDLAKGRGRFGVRTVIEANKLRAALTFSRNLKDTFQRGPVAELLAFERRGGLKVPPALTMEEVFKPGLRGGENIDALLATQFEPFGGRPALMAAAREFIIQKFFEQATDRQGRIVAQKMDIFLKKYGDSLNRFPGLKDQLSDASSAQRLAEQAAKKQGVVQKSLTDQRRYAAAVFLGTDIDKAMRALFSSKQPVAAARILAKQAATDATGEAADGLKQLFWEFSMTQIRASDRELGPAMRAFFLNNKITLRVMRQFYTPEDIRRLETVIAHFEIAGRAGRPAVRGEKVVTTGTSFIFDMTARVAGAKAGAALAGQTRGAPLILAGAGSRKFREFAGRILLVPERKIMELIETAIFDPNVMRTLLAPITVATERAIARQLRGHLANIGVNVAEDFEEIFGEGEQVTAPRTLRGFRPAVAAR